MHAFGGVYADNDVHCMRPVDEWNAVNDYDAALITGIEFNTAVRKAKDHWAGCWAS